MAQDTQIHTHTKVWPLKWYSMGHISGVSRRIVYDDINGSLQQVSDANKVFGILIYIDGHIIDS